MMQKLQPWILRETVTAVIGLIIVIWTMKLLAASLSNPSDENMKFAQGIFSILGGFVGVVLGYYFGRIPAERRADKAEEHAMREEMARQDRDSTVTNLTIGGSSLADRYKQLKTEMKLVEQTQYKQLLEIEEKVEQLSKAVQNFGNEMAGEK